MSEMTRNIRLRLLAVFFLSAAGLLYFSADYVYEKYAVYRNSRHLEQSVDYVEAAAGLILQLQRERGLSIASLSGKEEGAFKSRLHRQRARTDAAFGRFDALLRRYRVWRDETRIKALLSRYAKIGLFRAEIDRRTVSYADVLDYYSGLVDEAVMSIHRLGPYDLEARSGRTFDDFQRLLTLTELAGQERAIVAALLEGGDPARLRPMLTHLEGAFEKQRKHFFTDAALHTLQIYRRHVPASLERKYESVRRAIVGREEKRPIDTAEWWDLSTRYINALFDVDSGLLDSLKKLKQERKTAALHALLVSAVLWALFLLVLYSVSRYLSGTIRRFSRRIERTEEEKSLYKAFSEFSEYLVFHRNEPMLLDSLVTLLEQTGKFRYLWLGRREAGEIVPTHAENIPAALVRKELAHSTHPGVRRIRQALEQACRERSSLVVLPDTAETLLTRDVGAVGVFPVQNEGRCSHVLAVALPEGSDFETALIDLIQKMCNALGYAFEMLAREELEKRREEEQRIASTAFNAHEAITITGTDGSILQVNEAFTRITGYAPEEVMGENPSILKSGRHEKSFYVQMWDSIRKDGYWKGEIYNRRKNGEVYPEMLSISAVKDAEGKITHYVAHFFDITEMKEAQENAEYRAQHDPLTDLYNRQKLVEELELIYRRSQHTGDFNAFLFFDIDNFKHINDYYNHEVGDRVLTEVAERLRKVVHGEDVLARIAGDEFALVLCCMGTDKEVATNNVTIVLEKIQRFFDDPITVDGVDFEITFSIGVKVFPDREANWKEVMINADVAMYHAKHSGKNHYNFFDERLDQESKRFLGMKNDFVRALKEKELVLHYQPRIAAENGRIVGMEALVRWQHPELGLLYPDSFLYVTRGNSLGYDLNEYVIEQVCRQIEQWRRNYADFDLKISVNISGDLFNSGNYIENTRGILARQDPEVLRLMEFEIVEDALLRDIGHTIEVIEGFKAFGITFCMDDFGTGYSSINYLKRLPLEIIKIDREFVMDLFEEKNDEIVKMVVSTARIFGLKTVAEGVEDEETYDYLRRIGCDYFQGYYFSQGLDAATLESRWEQWDGPVLRKGTASATASA